MNPYKIQDMQGNLLLRN